MKVVSIHNAKTNLSKYIAAAKRGEKIYIGSYAKPEVVITAVTRSFDKETRNFDIAKGKLVATDDAFEPETDSLIAEMMTDDSNE